MHLSLLTGRGGITVGPSTRINDSVRCVFTGHCLVPASLFHPAYNSLDLLKHLVNTKMGLSYHWNSGALAAISRIYCEFSEFCFLLIENLTD